MLPLRTDTRYVTQDGKLTQAGFEALQGLLNAQGADIATLEAIEAGNVTNAPGSAPRFFPRAWVNFNGTGTPAIRSSGNVSSITDNGTGDYTINFTTAMPDANYAAIVTAGDTTTAAASAYVGWAAVYAAGSLRIGVSNNNTDLSIDAPNINVVIFR